MRVSMFCSAVFIFCGCSESASTSGIDKSEAFSAKADTDLQRRACRQIGLPPDCDLCQAAGWYGDGECDTFCDSPDPDCGAQCQSDADCPQIYCITTPCPFQTCQAGECKVVSAPDPDAGPGYDPCAGKACGEECSICDPADPSCYETAAIKTCDAQGDCQLGTYQQCGGNDAGTCPLTGIVCDPACENGQLPDSPGVPCQKGSWNQATCQCEPVNPPPYDPCAGKVCGDYCSLCDPADPNCIETQVLKTCNTLGVCQTGVTTTCSNDDCQSDADCPSGRYCSYCWTKNTCIPVGAVC